MSDGPEAVTTTIVTARTTGRQTPTRGSRHQRALPLIPLLPVEDTLPLDSASTNATDSVPILPTSVLTSASTSISSVTPRIESHPASPTVSPSCTANRRVDRTDLRTRIFSQLVDADAPVDEGKLRRAAASGVPASLRPQVWSMLLGVVEFQSSQELSMRPSHLHDYANLVKHVTIDPDITRRVRRVLSRSRSHTFATLARASHRCSPSDDDRPPSTPVDELNSMQLPPRSSSSVVHDAHLLTTDPPPPGMGSGGDSGSCGSDSGGSAGNGGLVRSVRRRPTVSVLGASRTKVVDTHMVARYSRVISAYLQNMPNIDFDEQLVHLVSPFLEIMPSEADAFYAFSAMMSTHSPLFTQHGLQDAVSHFKSMFRALHPDLYDLFVVEDVDVNKWARNWLRGLLVEQLPRSSLLRLWDSYFAYPPKDGLLLHPYVCLVFVQHIKSELLDCDDGERMSANLSSLPTIDTDHVIAHAITTRAQLCGRGVM